MPVAKILITGAAGFIGSSFARLARENNYQVVAVDKLTYAADLIRLQPVSSKCRFYKADICSAGALDSIFHKEKPVIVINFAAETHVDRSIRDSSVFFNTNVRGTQVLLDASRKYNIGRFIQISTDEVYGEIAKGAFREDSALNPSSPYSASKAAADLLVKSYVRTYSFPAMIIRPCNNYGPWQYPEKLIPLALSRIFIGAKVPVYADGRNTREWLYVDDCARGILKIMQKGKAGEIYNLGSGIEKQNIEVVRTLLDILKCPHDRVEFVKDRLGHDLRYKVDFRKAIEHAGWRPITGFTEGLGLTVRWARKHRKWLLAKLPQQDIS